jgi:hypothetical protein
LGNNLLDSSNLQRHDEHGQEHVSTAWHSAVHHSHLEEWPKDGEEMEFRLVLRGHLPSARRAGVDAKHRIRRELHPQLRVLWRQHPALRSSQDRGPKSKSRIEELADNYAKCGFRFVPLIKWSDFACSLDILILHREDPARIFDSIGDLDNRVKTLLDGLRMPDQCSEVVGQVPTADENPFFVLMDDDKAVSNFHVTMDKLLMPPEPNEPDRDAVAIISVKVATFAGPIAYWSDGF